MPVRTTVKNPKTGETIQLQVDRDDGVRPDANVAALGRLPPAFKKGGSTTAGNSSQVYRELSLAAFLFFGGIPVLVFPRCFSLCGLR